MPELPEVEAVAVTLRPLIRGATIHRCRVIHPIAVRPSSGKGAASAAGKVARLAHGRQIVEVERRGKYLLLCLDFGFIAMHFRLDGQLVWFDSDKFEGHVDVAFETDRGTLGFVDPRHFGRVYWHDSLSNATGIRRLGIDALSKEFTPARLEQLLASSRRPLKEFLLSQDKLAGIGNIYSSEALWRARLNPRKRANRISRAESRRLHNAIVDVLRRALKCCLDPAPDFRDADWWFQGLEGILQVYGRERSPCRRCGNKVRRIEQGGRSTYACLTCQK